MINWISMTRKSGMHCARQTEPLDCCFDLIMCHQLNVRWSSSLEIKLATTECKAKTLFLPNYVVLINVRPNNLVCLLVTSILLQLDTVHSILFTNPSTRAGYDTRSIFKRSLTGLNSEFSFSLTSCLTKDEERCLSYYLPIAGGRIIGFIPFTIHSRATSSHEDWRGKSA